RLCRDLKGTRPSTEVSGYREDLWSFDSDHLGRNSRQGDHVGGPIRDGEKRGFQHYERRLYPLEIPLAAHRRDVRHAAGRPHSDAAYRVYGRQGAGLGSDRPQAWLAAATLYAGFVVALRRRRPQVYGI